MNDIYGKITDISHIMSVYNKTVRKNTKNKYRVERFDDDYVKNICFIKNILDSKQYYPGKYNIFFIKESKLRLVMSQNMIDKLINHVVSKYFLVDVFESSLIDTNVATRVNKGSGYGILKLKEYIHNLSFKYNQFYYLKFDIKKYFFNIDHKILKKLLRKKIADRDALELLDRIIDSTDYDYINQRIEQLKNRRKEQLPNDVEVFKIPFYAKGKGLPIGNMTSQFFAILYLNELDHYIKEKLHIKYYIRYMDDGIIIHQDKKYLQFCLQEIKKILKKYQLELNDKTMIISSKQGVSFLGFRYLLKDKKIIVKINNSTKRKFRRKMKRLEGNHKRYQQVLASYHGHFRYCTNSKGLLHAYQKD